MCRYACAAVLCFGLLMLSANPAWTATIPVDTGIVRVAADGQCSLREAINNANANAQVDNTDCPAGAGGSDTLQLAAGAVYLLTEPYTAGSDVGLPPITASMTIEGNGATIRRDPALPCVLDGNRNAGEFRIFSIFEPSSLILRNQTIQGGCADGTGPSNDGGAIRVNANVLAFLDRVQMIDNHARDKSGAIDNNGHLDANDSTFSGNSAGGGGGAIGVGGAGVMNLFDSTLVGNSAGGDGGGAIGNLGIVFIFNSTITGNLATATGGGGIGNQGNLDISFSTVTENSTTGMLGGGGIGNAGTLNTTKVIVANNGAGGDCVNLGTLNAESENLDSDGSCTGFTQVSSAALALAPLADNGGPTQTHALLPGSVAIDAAAACLTTKLDPFEFDQRGVARPRDGNNDGTAACDIGAFEAANTLVVDGICTLGDAIEAANLDQTVGGCVDVSPGPDTIVLDVDSVLSSADTVRSSNLGGAFAGLPDITSDITIRAGAASRIERDPAFSCDVADGPNEFRLFNLNGGALRLSGVTLINGCANEGGALYLQSGSAILKNAVFNGHTARGAVFGAGGGAIYAGAGGVINIAGSSFAGNLAASTFDGGGAAVWIEDGAAVSIDQSNFAGNSVESRNAYGGAINDNGGLISLRNSRFTSNQVLAATSDAKGGAILLSSSAILADLIFEANLARGADGPTTAGSLAAGGALYADFGSDGASLNRALFRDNIVQGGNGDRGGTAEGGAARIDTQVTLDSVSFENNQAIGGNGTAQSGGNAAGGAIFACEFPSGSQLTISGNTARGGNSSLAEGGRAEGGGLLLECAPQLLQHISVIGNAAIGGIGPSGDGATEGGGLAAADPVEIRSSLLEGNTRTSGGVSIASDCGQSIAYVTSLGHNVVGAAETCQFTATGDQTGVGPSLLPLGQYGCATTLPDGSCLPVHPVALGSPAQDQGSCSATGINADARGRSRPWDDPGVANADDGCDAGAYESRDLNGNSVEDGVEFFGDPIFEDGFELG